MSEEIHAGQEMVTVPAALLQELLESNRDLRERVGKLEARLDGDSAEFQPAPDNRRTSLTVYAASLVRNDVQLYSATAHEAGKPPEERIEELTARGELEAAIRQLIRPHQLNFEAELGGRTETVKKLPAAPGADAPKVFQNGNWVDAYTAYAEKHAKTTSWTEPLPTGPYARVTYVACYLPAQTKVKGSAPALVSFTVEQNNKDIPSYNGFEADRQKLTCEFKDGVPERVVVTEESHRTEKGSDKTLMVLKTFTTHGKRMRFYQRGSGKGGGYTYEYPKITYKYIYDEARQEFVKTADQDDTWSPQEYLAELAHHLNRIPTLEA